MPSGVRSAIYTAVPLVSAIVIVLSTNPVVTTCVVGLCTGAAILVSWNASARIISDTLTVTNLSSFSSEAKGAEPSTPAMGVVTPGPWTNYPSTPTTEPQPLDMSLEVWLDQPANYWQPPVPGCAISAGEHVLSNDDITELSPYADWEGRLADWSARVPPNQPVYDRYVR